MRLKKTETKTKRHLSKSDSPARAAQPSPSELSKSARPATSPSPSELSNPASLARTPSPSNSGSDFQPNPSPSSVSSADLSKRLFSKTSSPPSTNSFSSLPDPVQPIAGSLRRLLPGSSPIPLTLEHFSFPVGLSGSATQWASSLSDLGLTSLKQNGNALELEMAESLDLQGRPHQFIRLRLEPGKIETFYTLRTDQHPARRRLQVLQLVLLTLSASGSIPYSDECSRHLAQALSDALALMSEDSDSLHLRLEKVQKQMADAQARLGPMEAQREADAKRALSDAQAIQTLQSRIQHLELLPDAALEEEIMEWLRAHDGSLSLRELSRFLGVGGARIEDMLDKLCKSGRIQRVK